MRFRPSGGLGNAPQRPDRAAAEARAAVVGEQPIRDAVYERRHAHEIERAENIAAGLPPEGPRKEPTRQPEEAKRQFREPHADIPTQVTEEKAYEPIPLQQQAPQGIMQKIRVAASTLVK